MLRSKLGLVLLISLGKFVICQDIHPTEGLPGQTSKFARNVRLGDKLSWQGPIERERETEIGRNA